MANRQIKTTRTPSKGRGNNMQLPQFKRVAKRTFTLVTTGDTDQDIPSTDNTAQKYIDLTQGDSGSVTKALVTAIYIRCRTAPDGTVAAASIGIYTEADAGGTNIVATAVLTGFTAAGVLKGTTLATSVAVITTGKLYVRQTVDSANAGTIDVIVEYIDLSDLE